MTLFLRDRVVHGLVRRRRRPTAACVAFLFTGDYAPLYWTMLVCNCLLPQALWFRRVRRSISAVVRDLDR